MYHQYAILTNKITKSKVMLKFLPVTPSYEIAKLFYDKIIHSV